jgi:hypothetical protein
MKSFNKEIAFEKLFNALNEVSKLHETPSKQIMQYVKLADFLEEIANKAYEEGFLDAVENYTKSDN